MWEPHQNPGPWQQVTPAAPHPRPALPPPVDTLDLLGFDDLDDDAAVVATPWWRGRGIAVVGVVVVVALLASLFVAHANGSKPPVTYSTSTVRLGNLTLSVSGTGPVSAAIYNQNFSVTGTLAAIDVKIGQQVQSGQVLAQLNTTMLQDAVNQAQLQANLAYDQEQNAIYQCDTEKSPPPDCVQQAQDQYSAVEAQLQTAKDNLAAATLHATHAGIVTVINGTVGSTPGSGSASGGSGSASSSSSSGFIQIVNSSSLQITAAVNEADIAGVATGQAVTFAVSAYPSRTFRGTVSAVSPVGQTTSSVVTFPVYITVDTTSLHGASLLTGMTATVTIITQTRTNVLLVPVAAITFARAAAVPSAGGFLTRAQLVATVRQGRQMLLSLEQQNAHLSADTPTVAWVLERANGQWVLKPVVLGLSNGSSYEVLAGLNAGETVVTAEQNGTITTTSAATSTGTGTGRGGGIFGGGGRGGGGAGAGG